MTQNLQILETIRTHRVYRATFDNLYAEREDMWFCHGCPWRSDDAHAGDVHLALEIGKVIAP